MHRHVAHGVLRPGAKWMVAAALAFVIADGARPARLAGETPAVRWPDVATGEAYAREVMAKFTPEQLEQALARTPAQTPTTLRGFGAAMMTSDFALHAELTRYVNAMAVRRARRVDRSLSKNGVRDVVAFAILDPFRFTEDAAFRARVSSLAPRALDPSFSRALRAASLRELNLLGLDFDGAEATASAWGVIAHRSSERQTGLIDDRRMPNDTSGPIETSIFSFNTGFFDKAGDPRAFLTALRASSPKRRIVVLADDEVAAALKGVDVEILPSFSRPYTPWPRDPFTVARTANGGVLLINRPNRQPEREEDANMVRALAQNLDASWTVAPIPFHNGHILLTPDAMYLSIHSVEIRALQILGIDAVPVKTFGTREGIEKYLNAVRQAAKDLESLYRKPARFVHPLDPDYELIRRLAGGGGFDLDSIMTLLPQRDGSLIALVGDISLGAKIARTADWKIANKAYGLSGNVAAAQSQRSTVALGEFLDTVAAHLAANGVKVQRLPLLNIPTSLAKGAPRNFLLTWNNVVLEANGDKRRAEGFASLIGAGDDYARKAFASAGYELELLPPLVKSITHSGGYRCASNHVRPW